MEMGAKHLNLLPARRVKVAVKRNFCSLLNDVSLFPFKQTCAHFNLLLRTSHLMSELLSLRLGMSHLSVKHTGCPVSEIGFKGHLFSLNELRF